MSGARKYKTEAELIASIVLFNGNRNSNYCKHCGKPGASSIGNSTYSQTHNYHWWHCRNCGADFDLVIQEHTLPAGMKSPFDKPEPAKRKSKQTGTPRF